MIIVNNQHNEIHLHAKAATSPDRVPLHEWNRKLQELFQFYIEQTPPKMLGRQLRNYFLLQVAGLTAIPPGWEDQVLHIIAMLELLDGVEDAQNISNH